MYLRFVELAKSFHGFFKAIHVFFEHFFLLFKLVCSLDDLIMFVYFFFQLLKAVGDKGA